MNQLLLVSFKKRKKEKRKKEKLKRSEIYEYILPFKKKRENELSNW